MPRFGKQIKKPASGVAKSGRPRKPTELHLLNGNPSNLNIEERQKTEPKFTKVSPDCPDWLDDYAKEEWNRMAPELERLGLLTYADMAAFAGYCQSYSDWRSAVEVLKIEKLIQTTETGYKQQHPAVGIRNSALEKMKSFLIEFGFTPASRSRVNAIDPNANQGKKKSVGGLMSR